MRIERRFGSGFNLHRGTNVIAVSRRYCRIPKQQTLTIGIVGINGNAGTVRLNVRLGESLLCNLCELPGERVLYRELCTKRPSCDRLRWRWVAVA